jgi:hypothetical protein
MDRNAADEVIESFLEGHPRAQEWQEWRRALAARLSALRADREALPPGANAAELDAQIAELEEYLAALTEEAAITEFVEASIRAAVAGADADLPEEDEGL